MVTVHTYQGIVQGRLCHRIPTLWTDTCDVPATCATSGFGIPSAQLELDEQSIMGRISLGAVYRKMGEPVKALHAWRELIDRNPQNYNAWYNLGMLFLAEGHLDEARNALQRAITINPDLVDAHRRLDEIEEKYWG